MSFGEKIAELRKKSGMTQNDLGQAMNVSYQAVSKWERDESQPDFETLSKIAKLFDVPITYFEEGAPAQPPQQPAVETPAKTFLGTCTECGKAVYAGGEGATSPKLVCKTCTERKKQQAIQAEQSRKRRLASSIESELGKKWGGKATVAVFVAIALYVLFTVLVFLNPADADIYAAALAFVPLCGFGITFSVADFIADLRDKDDEESYCLASSLITGVVFAIVNVALFLVLHLTAESSPLYLVLLGVGAVVSFTFISQFMWGGVVGEIFSAGGFTFKLPGFIITLSFDSILWMIVAKIFLAIIAAIVFVVTTIVVALVAMLGSVIIFFPSMFATLHKEQKAKAELKALK